MCEREREREREREKERGREGEKGGGDEVKVARWEEVKKPLSLSYQNNIRCWSNLAFHNYMLMRRCFFLPSCFE